jgi:hypothetical protein
MESSKLKGLVEHHQVAQVGNAFFIAIADSFTADKSRVTISETKRRFDICEGLFLRLRGDLKWSLPRALDMIPGYLRCELEGIAYDPSAQRGGLWRPSTDGTFAR